MTAIYHEAAVLDARVEADARMLADKASFAAEYHLNGATPSRSADADQSEKSDITLSMAAKRIAKHYSEVGDVKMHGEMVALANSLVARAA